MVDVKFKPNLSVPSSLLHLLSEQLCTRMGERTEQREMFPSEKLPAGSCQQLPAAPRGVCWESIFPILQLKSRGWSMEKHGTQEAVSLPQKEGVYTPTLMSILSASSPWQPASSQEGSWKQNPCSPWGVWLPDTRGLFADLAQRRHLPIEPSPLQRGCQDSI